MIYTEANTEPNPFAISFTALGWILHVRIIINKQIPWGIYVPRLIFIWGVKNGKVNQRTTGPVSNT